MEKILKRILIIIPLLFVSLSIKNVYAETTNIYWASAYGEYRFSPFSSNINEYTPNSLSFKAYNNDFVLYNGFNYNVGNSKNFCFILYDKVNDLYILQCNVWDYKDLCYKYENKYYVDIRDNRFYCKDSSGSWIGTNYGSNWYSILSTKDESSYFQTIDNSLTPTILNNGIYYLTQNNSNRTWGLILTFLINNSSNFELAGIDNDFILYINSIEVPKLSESEPEEPEEPEEPNTPTLPPYNFKNNKYYVPNYEKGNCVEVLDKDTIRVFKDENTSFYIDYYINSNYISKSGQVEVDYVKNCSTLEFTDIRYYGNDFPQILFITIVICGFTIFLPFILYKRFKKR